MISIQSSVRSSISSGANVVLFCFENAREPEAAFLFGQIARQALEEARQEGFTGKRDQISLIRPKSKEVSRIILVGLGAKDKTTSDSFRRAASMAARKANDLGLGRLAIAPGAAASAATIAQACTEGVLLGLYQFTAFQSKPSKSIKLNVVHLIAKDNSDQRALQQGIRTGLIFSDSVNLVRDLVNTPPSDMDPASMAKIAKSIAGGPIKVQIFNKAQIQKMGMGGLLGVNRGSAKDPVFVHLVYKPKGKARRKIGICGKGITFDSGGLSLKPAKSMETMKDDMAGAATVFSIFKALAKLQPPIEVHGFTPITENMPGGDACKPGDVLKTMRGKTIEVLNTDAEGRLVLSDALSFACRQNLDEVLDIATLTGACVIALGTSIAGILGTDDKLIGRIKKAVSEAGEKIWELPLEEDYEAHLKSHVADIKNIGLPMVAGTIMGALFLKAFVDEGVPWAHIDIASTAWAESGTALSAPGATGVMVRSLLTYLLSYN